MLFAAASAGRENQLFCFEVALAGTASRPPVEREVALAGTASRLPVEREVALEGTPSLLPVEGEVAVEATVSHQGHASGEGTREVLVSRRRESHPTRLPGSKKRL